MRMETGNAVIEGGGPVKAKLNSPSTSGPGAS
jgi:hypothetical protein